MTARNGIQALQFLTSSQVQRLHTRWISRRPNLQQPSMLESAIHSPINLKHYGSEENVPRLAADLAQKIMRNHAHMDGNKRTALMAAGMFLSSHGYDLTDGETKSRKGETADLADAHVAVVTGRWSVEELGRFYEAIGDDYEGSNKNV